MASADTRPVVVTGAVGGIGRSIAEAFGVLGDHVVVLDVADAVVFLGSDASSTVTGQVLNVDAGIAYY